MIVAGAPLAIASATAGVFSDQRVEIEACVEKGLENLAKTQMADGTFPNQYGNLPGVVGLAGMSFLAKGYMPDEGKYGETLNLCVDFVLSHQGNSGVFYAEGSSGSSTNMYSHCLATLFLSEVSGCVDEARQEKVNVAVGKGLNVILRAQAVRKQPRHRGGWRYSPGSTDSDLSVSGWAIMALRSARLNGAPVPDAAIDAAIRYVMGMYNRNNAMFGYSSNGGGSVSMTAVGVLCLELTGKHGHPIIQPASKAILDGIGAAGERHKSSAYANYYVAQSMFQVGGEQWENYAAWMYPHYLNSQNNDGSWGAGGHALQAANNVGKDSSGSAYETAMTLLALSVPFRQLPIYQRDATLEEEAAK
jgi:hypothetical protein